MAEKEVETWEDVPVPDDEVMPRPPVPEAVDRLAQWRDEFSTRRTVPWQMFDAAEGLVRSGLAERETFWRSQISAMRLAHSAEVRALERTIEHERTMRGLAEDTAARIKAHNTNLEVEMEREDDLTKVKVKQPTIYWAKGVSNKTIPRPWHIGELENLTSRLRVCGGDEYTPVDFKHGYVEVAIPIPEMALFPAGLKDRPEPKPQSVEAKPPRFGLSTLTEPSSWSAALGVGMVLAVIVAITKIVGVLT